MKRPRAERMGQETDCWDMWNEQEAEEARLAVPRGDSATKKAVVPPHASNIAAEQQIDIPAEIARLAALSHIEYEIARRSIAKRLEVRVSYLDALVYQKRAETEPNPADHIFAPIAPWDQPVEAGLLLTEIAATIRSFVLCPPEAANTAALWVALSWMVEAVHCCPLLILTSPEPRCGKSTLLAVLSHLVCRPLMAGNIKPTALVKVIDVWQPALLIDGYADFMGNKELRHIVTSGHVRDTASAIRALDEDNVPATSTTFGPKILAGTGHLPAPLRDRAIVLKLRRKLPSEKIIRLRHADPTVFRLFAV